MGVILQATALRKRFRGGIAVNDLSFEVEPGEVFAFLGPNGAGKTTTLRMLLDIIAPDSGSVTWHLDGRAASRVPPDRVGYLPEDRGLYPDLPVLRTLVYLASIRGMPRHHAKQEALRWLERLELANRANDKLQALSKGNQQKVQFIASILHQPTFAILDEPFSGLDPINQELFLGLIRELREQGMTILLSAHQMDLVDRIATHILLIQRGMEVFHGTLEALKTQHGEQLSFEVTFDSNAPREALQAMPGVVSLHEMGQGKTRIDFGPQCEVHEALKALSSFQSITQVRSVTPSLHEIYLSRVGESAANSLSGKEGNS